MISVIIPVKNADQTLAKCLHAILHQEGMQLGQDYEVIVVDNGSTDNTARIAEENKVTIIRQSNAGPATARNAGAKVARGSLLAFTGADCIPCSTWLIELTQPFTNQQVVGVKGVNRTHLTYLTSRFVQLEYEYKYERMKKQAAIEFAA